MTDTVFPAQEQVCGVWYEASVQEVLREVPPGIEEEVKEAVWRCCTEVNAWSLQAAEVEGRQAAEVEGLQAAEVEGRWRRSQLLEMNLLR